MSRLIRIFKWIPKNPKKSVFFSLVGWYGVDYFHDKYLINQVMRTACLEARTYGESKAPLSHVLKKVLVVLNPAANKRNAEENFEKYCAPILYLAGYDIEIVKTKSETDAIRYFEEELGEYPEAIVVAGGDGTISETVTGLLRKAETDPRIPTIGVLPVGKINQFSFMLFNNEGLPKNKVEEVQTMANAALAIVRGKKEKKDVMRIQLIQDPSVEQKKPFFAVGNLLWGSFNDIMRKKDRYWLTGSLRTYTAFLFNGFGGADVNWECRAKLITSEPCSGCSNCYEKPVTKAQKLQSGRWWSQYNAQEKAPEYSKILNPNCQGTREEKLDASELVVSTNTVDGITNGNSKLNIRINTKKDDYGFDYILHSWNRLWNRQYLNLPEEKVIEARTLTLLPESRKVEDGEEEKDIYFSIDNESYEVMPINITLLPKRVEFFIN